MTLYSWVIDGSDSNYSKLNSYNHTVMKIHVSWLKCVTFSMELNDHTSTTFEHRSLQSQIFHIHLYRVYPNFLGPKILTGLLGAGKKNHSTLWPFCQLRPADQYKIIQQVHIHYVIPNTKKNYEISSHHPEFACFFRVQRPGGSKNLKQITEPWASKFSQDPATSKEFLQKQKGLRSFLPFILASWLSLTL